MVNEYETLTEALTANASDALSVTYIEGAKDEVTVSYRELRQRALRLLHCFQQRGLGPGDELVFFLRRNEDFIDAFWACLYGGIVPVPVAVGISDEHRAKALRIFARLRRPHLLTDNSSMQLLEVFAESSGAHRELALLRERTLRREDLSPGDALGAQQAVDSETRAFIQFSSGSTRDPKGVCLTHRNLLVNVGDISARAQYRPDDISLSWMPLTHDMGLIGFHINMVIAGMTQNLMATDLFSRRPLLWLQKAQEKRATVLCSPNFGYRHYLKLYQARDDQQLDLSRVRTIFNGAEPISVGLSREFLDTLARHGLRRSAIYPAYGLAEATLAVSLPTPGREFEYVAVNRRSLGVGSRVLFVDANDAHAVHLAIEGPPVDRCRVRAGDAAGRDFGQEVVGEVQLRGPNVTAGYYQDAAANEELFTPDGWLRTGDLGFLHQGLVVITGRLKDIIFVNGQNFYPHDIEAVALADDRLEVGKVAVVGVRRDDADHDEVLVCILFRGDVSEFVPIVKNVRAVITRQTGVEVTHVLPVRRIPKTTSGKVQRRFLADSYLRGEFDHTIADIAGRLAPARAATAAASSSELAALMKSIFDRIVTDKNVGLGDDLFEIGMSSLELAQIHEQIDEMYPNVLDITDLFEHPTIESIAELLHAKLAQPTLAPPAEAGSGKRESR